MTGRDLRMHRQTAGVTQPMLARVSGLHIATLVDIERERLKPAQPSLDTLAGMCDRIAALPDVDARWAFAKQTEPVNPDPHAGTRGGRGRTSRH